MSQESIITSIEQLRPRANDIAAAASALESAAASWNSTMSATLAPPQVYPPRLAAAVRRLHERWHREVTLYRRALERVAATASASITTQDAADHRGAGAIDRSRQP